MGQQHRKERTHQARCLRIEIYEGKEKSCLRVGLNRAQMAQTGKAGAVRLCTYRRQELGPHLDGVPWRHLLAKPESQSPRLYPAYADRKLVKCIQRGRRLRARA